MGGKSYCQVCGTLLAAPAGHAAPKRVSLDLAPRPRTNATTISPAGPQQLLVADQSRPAAAQSLHQRTTLAKPHSSKTLDLSQASVEVSTFAAKRHDVPAAPPHSTTHERHQAHLSARLAKAKEVERSPLVDKFVRPRLSGQGPHGQLQPLAPVAPAVPRAPIATRPVPRPEPGRQLPADVATSHAAMAQLPRLAPAPDPKPPVAPSGHGRPWRPNLKLSHSRVATIGCIVAVMSAYIWMQNYPKLALHNAIDKAGVAGSLPSYVPSSYRLANTQTDSGLITLNFKSPSSPDLLKIAQHSTSWDSRSLLDNFVSKKSDDYATVQNQGLTIYLYNNNHATWVNHGVWYSIEGAGRLSREQILKIAYSL